MEFKYRMFNAPSAHTIDRAAELGCNWVIAHSAGIEKVTIHPESGRETDMYPIWFEDYPKVAQVRRYRDAHWIDPMRREVAALCDRAHDRGLKVAFHMYEPVLPHLFEREYPELVGVWKRPTQSGTVDVHTCVDPDNPAVWDLIRNKYAELARTFPLMDMAILTTWDGSGTYWCIPQAKMPIHRRLVRMVEAALAGVRSVRPDCAICFRLWGRNWPGEMYRDGHRLIAETTGVENADELMERVVQPHNDPDVILPAVFAELPDDVPIMYKSTNIDIADAQSITLAAGTYPADREQIIEISYEQYHHKAWPWCKVAHFRTGLAAAAEHNLAGFLALPVNMGNNDRACAPDAGNLGRMNTALLARLLSGDEKSDVQLVADWLADEYGAPQPVEAAEALVAADTLASDGIYWGRGIPNREPFASLHTTKLYWMFDGFADPAFPFKMADADAQTLEAVIATKADACERAFAAIETIKAVRVDMHVELFDELIDGLTMLAESILLCRDWHSHLAVQYGIERGVFAADRKTLGRMSRYGESFIRNLVRLRDQPAGKWAMGRLSFPDEFPLT